MLEPWARMYLRRRLQLDGLRGLRVAADGMRGHLWHARAVQRRGWCTQHSSARGFVGIARGGGSGGDGEEPPVRGGDDGAARVDVGRVHL